MRGASSPAAAAPSAPSAAPSARNRIVGFVADDLSAAALRTGLEGKTVELRRGNIRHAIKLLESDTDMFAIVADISGISDPIPELEHLSRVCPPDVQVALIGDISDMAFYRTVVNEMGAVEYMSKPLTRDSVQLVLLPKFGGTVETIVRGGHVVSVLGAQGGAGATSMAINLALMIAETTKAKVALLDLNLQGGEMAVMLGARPGPGLRIALEDPARADTLFLDRASIPVNDRVRLFAAEEDLDSQLALTEAGVRHVMDLLRQRFSFIVVDMPVPLIPAIHPVISLSRQVLLMLEAEITGLRNATTLGAVVRTIAGRNRLFTVLNRADRAGGLPLATIVKALGAPPDLVIPDLGKGMTQAVNSGVPALYRVSRLRRALSPMVREIAGTRSERGWIGRLFGR